MKRYPFGWRLALLGAQVVGGVVTAHVYQQITIGWWYA